MRTRHTPAQPQRNRRILRLDVLENRDVPAPVILDPNLAVRPVVSGLTTPTSIAVLGTNDLLVLEKDTGQVKRVVNGVVQDTLIDLAVNNASERGLLGIALDPNFRRNQAVYLYWTQPADPAPGDGTFPSVRQGPDQPALGADTGDVLAVPLLGNRVDRFILEGDSLVWDRNLIRLRVFQNDGVATPPNQGDEGQPALGNHDGGVIRFGRDGKLYVIVGDLGRRGLLQNNLLGPVPDDQFGGPFPDDAHFSGVVLRLNTDGTAPSSNPFFGFGRAVSVLDPELGENLQKVYAYGIRNSFGLAIDPFTGNVWDTENGDDSFDEVNLVRRGFNSGWIQTMGPLERVDEFKQIETTFGAMTLQQLRYPPSRIADSPAEAQARMLNLPGSQYSDPEFSWKFAVPPTALEFATSASLGRDYSGDLILGNGAGQLMDFNLNFSRTGFRFSQTGLRRPGRRQHDEVRAARKCAVGLCRRASTSSPTSSAPRMAACTSSPSPTERSTRSSARARRRNSAPMRPGPRKFRRGRVRAAPTSTCGSSTTAGRSCSTCQSRGFPTCSPRICTWPRRA